MSIFRNSSEAMMVTDADNRIAAVNPAFSQITGYSADEAVGKDPKMLKSDRQNDDFYREMWEAVNATGHWQGEIWNRRKNGEAFPEWLTINTLYNADGAVQRRVALFSDITERKRSEELIWRQANFDPLTRLPNRNMFRDRLYQDIKKAQRAGLSVALLFIDLDHFKEVNDTLGHGMGDLLLVKAAHRISACVREADTVARLGGDEFTVTLMGLADESHVEKIAQNIITRLAEPFQLGHNVARVSASIGITLYPADAAETEALLKHADQAMYAAKNAGRNRFSYFTPTLQEAAQHRLQLINDLHGALTGGQFVVYFQPIVELATGRIFKAEALLRWQHPRRGMVGPADFVAVAEETGLIADIGDWVFMEALRWAKRWAGLCPEVFQVAVNKSPAQFRARNGTHNDWLVHLREFGLSGQNLVIEITESLLLDAQIGIAERLLMFHDAGIQVAIDDFGTGYSALSYLKKFDIDYLKIDQSFVRNLVDDPSDKALVEAIIVLAHKLGLQVIAEGVETEAQKDFLAAAGCDFAQGYLFSRPVPPEAFEQVLKNNLVNRYRV
jgi:diguanylate cyclase (GGDEF)-like protein/PAS domain S-box-containing protein